MDSCNVMRSALLSLAVAPALILSCSSRCMSAETILDSAAVCSKTKDERIMRDLEHHYRVTSRTTPICTLSHSPGDRDRVIRWSNIFGGTMMDSTVANTEQAFRLISFLEKESEDGTLYDVPTVLLAILQVPRFLADGTDNARKLAQALAAASVTSNERTEFLEMCVFAERCNLKRFRKEEVFAVTTPIYPFFEDMNSQRSILIDTAVAAVFSYIVTMDQPSAVTGEKKTASDVLLEDRAKTLDKTSPVVKKRTEVMHCILHDDASLDLKSCAKAGARLAIYDIAENGLHFREADPLNSDRLFDVP